MTLVVQTLEAEKKLLSTELERANAKFQECFQDKCNLSAQLRFAQSNYDTTCVSHPFASQLPQADQMRSWRGSQRLESDMQWCDMGLTIIIKHAIAHTLMDS